MSRSETGCGVLVVLLSAAGALLLVISLALAPDPEPFDLEGHVVEQCADMCETAGKSVLRVGFQGSEGICICE